MLDFSRFCAPAVLLLGMAVSSCGTEPDSSSNATGGAAGTDTSGSTGGTGNTGGAGLGVGGGTLSGGYFYLYSIVASTFNRMSVVSASFYAATSACPVQTFGDCVLHSACTGSATTVSAGTLTVTSPATATLAANNVTISPNTDNTYDQAALSGLFSGAEVANISASGASVPAFSAALTVPLVLLIDSPTPDADGTIQANSSSDLVIQFSRGTTGVVLSAQPINPASSDWLECNSAPGANSLTIPAAALAATAGQLYLVTRATEDIVAGDFTVNVGVMMNAYMPNKTTPVTIQIN